MKPRSYNFFMMKGSFIIYSLAQIAIYLVLGFRYGLFTLTYIDQLALGSLSLTLVGLFFILTWKSAGEIQLQAKSLSLETLSNISQVQIDVNSELNHLFCEVCKVIQRPRSFHCNICKKCIPTYDHHCGFLGKCIGEKNRQIFSLFFLFQSIQSIIYLIYLIKNLIETGDRSNDKVMLISISLIVSFLMCTLLIFETYFMISNLTMGKEEFKNSSKSSYSKGVFMNLYQFWILGFKKELIDWKETKL